MFLNVDVFGYGILSFKFFSLLHIVSDTWSITGYNPEMEEGVSHTLYIFLSFSVYCFVLSSFPVIYAYSYTFYSHFSLIHFLYCLYFGVLFTT